MKELYDKTNDGSSTSIIVPETVYFAINSKLRKKKWLGSCAANCFNQKREMFGK